MQNLGDIGAGDLSTAGLIRIMQWAWGKDASAAAQKLRSRYFWL